MGPTNIAYNQMLKGEGSMSFPCSFPTEEKLSNLKSIKNVQPHKTAHKTKMIRFRLPYDARKYKVMSNKEYMVFVLAQL